MERRITPKLAAASLSSLLILAAFPVEAGNDTWTVAGSPAGGGVYKLIVDPSTPSTLYATSGSGVYKSTDSGSDWSLVFPTLNGPNDLELDPLHPQTLYVSYSGDSSKTLFKTTDGGSTWTECDTGIGTVEDGTSLDVVGGLAVDPLHEGVVYASAGNTGVYKSSDGGAHWSSIDTGLSSVLSTSVHAMLSPVVVDPAHPNVLYLGTAVYGLNGGAASANAQSGIYQSTDSGAHWVQRVDHEGFDRITVDPSNDQNVYAGGGYVYSSSDGGNTWAPSGSLSPVEVILVDPTDSLHMWGSSASGLEETTDGGTTWNLDGPSTSVFTSSIAVDPVTPANQYVATDWGVFKSTDAGATWSAATTGIHNVVVDMMFEGADGIVYLASEGNGIYKSTDQGASWAEVGAASGVTGSLPIAGDIVYSLVEDPTANSTLYAATNDGLYKSIDGGDSWTESDTGIATPRQILSLVIDPEAPATLYAATNLTAPGVYKSVDGGATWAPSGTGLSISPNGGLQALAVDPHDSNVVYAGAYATGLFKSIDGGATWQSDDGAMGVTDIWSVAVDPSDSKVVYVFASDGAFKSTDAGATWVESDSGLGEFGMTDVQFDPSDSAILYVSPRYGAGDSYMSPDGGADWFDLATLASGSQSAAKAVSRKVSRRTSAIRPGIGMRRPQDSSTGQITIGAVVVDPRKSKQILGGGTDGQVYALDVKHLPTAASSSSGGGSGGSTPPAHPAAGGGGGGNFGLLLIFGLMGFVARRRR